MPLESDSKSLHDIAQFYRRLQVTAVLAGLLCLLWLLAPVITPFVIAALLGWLGDPLVDKLEKRGMGRNTAVIVVFVCMALLLALVLGGLVPLIQRQIGTLVESVPKYRDWLLQTALPWLEAKTHLRIEQWLAPGRLIDLIRTHLEQAGGVAATMLGYLSRSGFALVAMIANIVLLPVLTFFFLRDWDVFVERVATLVPPRLKATTTQLARESADILRAFLRGQFLVMLILGALYGIGLWLVGLDLGILIGLVAGLLTFVPYLGPATVIVLGGIAALVQYGDWQHLVGVAVVFGVGQVIESYVLTPKLVGDRIGLHPVAVIFAVLAGGQLFGFLGMLVALPVAAVANVLLKHAHERYLHSTLYAGETPGFVLEGDGDGLAPIEANADAHVVGDEDAPQA